MSNEIEYIEPTQDHVGQMVEVRDRPQLSWRSAKLTGIINEPERFVAKKPGDDYSMSYRYARIGRPLTYAERQAKCGLKVGDRVKFVRAWTDGELGTHLEFYDEMTPSINKVGVITDIKKSIRVEFGSVYWWLPYFVLEKVEDRVARTGDVGKIVYVDGAPQDEFTLDGHYISLSGHLYGVIVSGGKRFVYELSNLRVKE